MNINSKYMMVSTETRFYGTHEIALETTILSGRMMRQITDKNKYIWVPIHYYEKVYI